MMSGAITTLHTVAHQRRRHPSRELLLLLGRASCSLPFRMRTPHLWRVSYTSDYLHAYYNILIAPIYANAMLIFDGCKMLILLGFKRSIKELVKQTNTRKLLIVSKSLTYSVPLICMLCSARPTARAVGVWHKPT